ncbi:DAO domain-containing protein [Fusarium falciforme]|uniref:DAO domain-containing protein n=1 Tax=Fusarium falciforme TaxID=195108 RepID=UPI002300FB6B|nr:DAO domain-containing protein [Fusarium falciforme]WAO92106.1 DAO domain-containing protein [Fusarium falciforme]
MAPTSLKQQIKDRLCLTAGLPSAQPTLSAWQEPPAPIATIQSETLPPVTDIAIIGSGITGTSVAHTLLNHRQASNFRVTILEARNACSGATGRNGGHLISDTCGHFEHLVASLGTEEAVKILRFSEANIKELKALVDQLIISSSTITDKPIVDSLRRSLSLLQEAVNKTTLAYRIVEDGETIRSKYKYRDGLAVFEQEGAGALWPYRLITILQKHLLDTHAGRFSLETNTPVVSISHDENVSQNEPGYVLQTPRGTIQARKLIHCTNGYSSHLLPSLTGSLYPLRGTVSVQDPGQSFPKLGDKYSWTKIHTGGYNLETRCLTTGLYYAQQNAKTGEIVIRGESQEIENLLTSDDSQIADSARNHISSIVPKIFLDADDAKTKKVWSGIMGFTADNLPMIGNLSRTTTGRTGSDEWIAAGFNGHGMDKCWLSGQAAARMALGEDVPSWLPESFLVSEERLKACTLDAAAEGMMSLFTEESSKS